MDKTYVYFARASTGEIKIGVSRDPFARIATLNTGSAYPIALMKMIPGDTKLERSLHERFAHERLNGEWFYGGKELLEYIASLHAITQFDYLSVLEPRLTGLLVEAQLVRDKKSNPSFCANDVWYRQLKLKKTLTRLVGWWAETDIGELKTSEVYNTAYSTIYGALPACRNCQCVGVQV